MTVIRCVTMQKNEATLLEPWILWHGAIFGLSNLTVVDNGSTNPHVKDVQKRYEAQGVQIIRKYRAHKDFLRKGEIFTDIIRGWDAEDACDFALPMDCDEFLAFFLDRLSVDPAEIRAQFELLKEEQATLITDRLLLNVPNAPNYYRPQSVPRALFKAHTIVGLDRGLHAPQTIYPERCVRTPFVHLHLHNRPDYEDIRRFARQKLAHIAGAIPGEKPRAGQITPENPKEGYHLRYYFQASQEDFLRSYLHTPDIYAPVIADHFRGLGVDPAPILGDTAAPQFPVHVPQNFLAHRRLQDGSQHEYVLFDPLSYAHENEDVVKDAFYGIWPLIHYMDAGWREGRRPNASGMEPFLLQAAAPTV